MKKVALSILTFICLTYTMGQTINYNVIKNEPIEPNISINLDFFNLDLNTDVQNLRTDNMSFNAGLFGYVKLAGPLEVDFNVHRSWLVLGKISFQDYPGHTELNGGINFWLTKRDVTKDTRVVLKSDVSRSGNIETTSTTYITVPALHRKRIGLRGGLYSKSGPFNFEAYAGDLDNQDIVETKISSFGIYGGFNFRTITNIIIKDNVYGRSMNSAGRDVYIDAIFAPINRFKDLNNDGDNVSETIRGLRTTSPIGFRLGYKTYQVEKKNFTGKKFGICGIGEFGYKPYQGWFITAGFGVTLVKNAKQ